MLYSIVLGDAKGLLWAVVGQGVPSALVAPYCAIPRDYLSDTPLLRAMGFLVSQHGQLGAIPPPPFLSVSPLESMRSGGAIPPPQKGYLSDTCAIPYENKANGCDTPVCDTISKGYCAIWGGISHWAAKPSAAPILTPRLKNITYIRTSLGELQSAPPRFSIGLLFRNEKSAQRGSFRTDVPADIRPKTSVRPSKSWKKNRHFGTDMPRGLRSEKLRADFSFPIYYFSNEAVNKLPTSTLPQFILGNSWLLVS